MTPAELRALADQATLLGGVWYSPDASHLDYDDSPESIRFRAAMSPDAARLLADAMEYVEARHDGMDWANDLVDRFASLGEETP